MKKYFYTLIATTYVVFASCSTAEQNATSINLHTEQRLIIDNLNMPGSIFWALYMSTDKHQRQAAEMYLAGVLDSSEGKQWCGYPVALPGSIQELIYMGFQKLPQNHLEQRASTLIINILSSKLPCKE